MKRMTHIGTNWMPYKTCKRKYFYTNDFYWSAIIKLYTQVYPVIIGGRNVNFLKKETQKNYVNQA